jgi:hypothetical protein
MSKNPGQFKDIGKDANDLLNKGYDDYDTKFEINAVGLNASVKASFTKNQEKTSGSLEYKTKCEKCGDLTTTLDFGKSVKVSAVSKDKFIQKLDTTLEFSSNPAKLFDDAKLKLVTDYAHDAATISNSVTYPVSGAGATLVSSLVVGSKEHGVVLGGEFELSAARSQLTRGEGALSYKKGSIALALFSKTNRDNTNNALNHKFGANLHYRLAAPASWNPINQLAFETVYNPKASNLDIAVAASAKPDATSTLKAKVNSNGNINVAFNKDLEKPLSVAVFAATSLHSVSDVKLGLKLAYTQ